jgi:hypothetical protein
MMCPEIDNPARCEIRAAVRFLHTKNVSSAEIHRELCAVYGQKVMGAGIVRKWCSMFEHGRKMFTINSEVVGHL